MKTLDIFRGKSEINFKCTNGDVYDSSATLSGEVDGRPIEYWHSEYVNTDSTFGYKGGRLAKGGYYGIVGYRQPKPGESQGKRVIKLFSPDGLMPKTADDLTIQMMTLPSEIPNPNHDNQLTIQYVQVHDGGKGWDFSHGCITVYRYAYSPKGSDWERLMEQLIDNEILKINLIAQPIATLCRD